MKEKALRMRGIGAAGLAAWLAVPPSVGAVELTQKTIEVFDHYVSLSEARMAAQDSSGAAFLWVERLPELRQGEALSELRHGGVVIERLEMLENGKPLAAPHGLIYHWIGTVFILGATLRQTLAVIQDYDHHQHYYKPDVMRSKILMHDGNDFDVSVRFYKRKIITVVMETEHNVHYTPLDAKHEKSVSHSTHIHEVENPGESGEKLKPEGNDRGFLWRIYSYWRFEEKDGGAYVECQSISLTRDIPGLVARFIRGYVERVPRESLRFTLDSTRAEVLHQPPQPN